jgi:polysaccharide pyruvyl transferase WcaK-like protein
MREFMSYIRDRTRRNCVLGNKERSTGAERHFHLIDTSIASDNVGDEIIVNAARRHLAPFFKDAYITTSAGHDGLGPSSRALVQQADCALMLGTNALSPCYQVPRKFIWHIEQQDVKILKNKVVLLGVGANCKFETIEPQQIKLLKTILSDRHIHSVRDSLGASIVAECGRKAVNTSCPTLWWWAERQLKIPARRADTVCFTLTKHKPHPADAVMINILRRTYANLWFWPQQPRDLNYLRELTPNLAIKVLPPNLQAYDQFLKETTTDVVGTRLHGGIRGLEHGRRTLIIAIDNRAEEIGADTNLPILLRSNVETELENRLSTNFEVKLHIDTAALEIFLGQFRKSE